MTTPRTTTWEIDRHTRAKHQILQLYLEAWFPILNTVSSRVLYIDGFCGPGRYAGGERGSPVIAVEVARDHKKRLSGELVFWFIDGRQDRIDHLEGELIAASLPQHFEIHLKSGFFADELDGILSSETRGGRSLPPTFAFIDPFGFKGVPFSVIGRLLNHRYAEVLITLMVDPISRFVEHPREAVVQQIVQAFGTDQCIEIAKAGGDRVANLRVLYHRQLNTIAEFVRSFEMKNRQNRPLYFLFFATKSPTGHKKMKDAMWKVDPEGYFSFSDGKNPSQMILFGEDVALPLGRELEEEFGRAGRTRVREIRKFVDDRTDFLEKHMRAALKRHEDSGRIVVQERKADGKKRKKGTFPDEVVLEYVTVS